MTATTLHRWAEERAVYSAGISNPAIYALVARELSRRGASGTLLDVGCGKGDLIAPIRALSLHYIGIDLVRHGGFPTENPLIISNLDGERIPLADRCADVAVSVETIEHLENPRAFIRELVRLVKPGGWIAVTTPNQLSLMSKLALVTKNQFVAFQEAPGLYPAHLTALLESDLLRIAAESSLTEAAIYYTDSGRIPLTSLRWPRWCRGRLFSDNLMLLARKPGARAEATVGVVL